MRLAADLRLPLVTIVDTPGGELSPAAEEDGIAREIARSLVTLITLPVPTVSVLLGQGTGGAALALLPADRVLAAQHAWLSPLAPEGASVIVYRDAAHAPELAARQGIRSADLSAAGIVDHIVAEASPHQLLRDLGRALQAELRSLGAPDDETRLDQSVPEVPPPGPAALLTAAACSPGQAPKPNTPRGCALGLARMAPGIQPGKLGTNRRSIMRTTETAIGAVAARAAVLAALVGLAAGCSSSSSTGGASPATAPASSAATSTASASPATSASVAAAAFADIIEPWDPGHPARSQTAPADCGDPAFDGDHRAVLRGEDGECGRRDRRRAAGPVRRRIAVGAGGHPRPGPCLAGRARAGMRGRVYRPGAPSTGST